MLEGDVLHPGRCLMKGSTHACAASSGSDCSFCSVSPYFSIILLSAIVRIYCVERLDLSNTTGEFEENKDGEPSLLRTVHSNLLARI